MRHRTHYAYEAPVAVCQNQLRMRPRNLPLVEVHRSDTSITPTPDTRESHIDYFGNEVETFSIEALHDSLLVEIDSEVTVRPIAPQQTGRKVAWTEIAERLRRPVISDLLDVGEFAYPSPRIPINDEVRKFAEQSFQQHPTLIDAAVDLTKRIHQEFEYNSHATHVDTTVQEAFRLRAGVCQDLAQIQIACLRSMGLAARYVSGYLRTVPPDGQEKLVGADESHAWLSLFVGRDEGWLDLDPTNGCIASVDHIPICFGRDYFDVSPMRGVAIGGGQAALSVNVDVRRLEPDSTPLP
ncbi:MAG: transglutaminase family protein [Planctomycetota bacterium]